MVGTHRAKCHFRAHRLKGSVGPERFVRNLQNGNVRIRLVSKPRGEGGRVRKTNAYRKRARWSLRRRPPNGPRRPDHSRSESTSGP